MAESSAEMIDFAFDLDGGALSSAYPFALWAELVRHVPQLGEDAATGVLPLRAAESGEKILLTRRAKLVLRLPPALAVYAAALSGLRLEIDGSTICLGAGKLREIQPYSTLHAHLVAGAEDEVEFIGSVTAELAAMDVQGKLICGRSTSLVGAGRAIHGFSLVIHDLKPEASLRLQYTGLSSDRRYGCGVFVPYKVITGLD